MPENLRAFVTRDPVIVAAYRDMRARWEAQQDKIGDAIDALGNNTGALAVRDDSTGAHRIVGLRPADRANPPAGWMYDAFTKMHVPADPAAHAWLAEHQPVDPYTTMAEHGLPPMSWTYQRSGGYTGHVPGMFDHDDAVWAIVEGTYRGPFGESYTCTWEPVDVDRYFEAETAHRAAKNQAAKNETAGAGR